MTKNKKPKLPPLFHPPSSSDYHYVPPQEQSKYLSGRSTTNPPIAPSPRVAPSPPIDMWSGHDDTTPWTIVSSGHRGLCLNCGTPIIIQSTRQSCFYASVCMLLFKLRHLTPQEIAHLIPRLIIESMKHVRFGGVVLYNDSDDTKELFRNLNIHPKGINPTPGRQRDAADLRALDDVLDRYGVAMIANKTHWMVVSKSRTNQYCLHNPDPNKTPSHEYRTIQDLDAAAEIAWGYVDTIVSGP